MSFYTCHSSFTYLQNSVFIFSKTLVSKFEWESGITQHRTHFLANSVLSINERTAEGSDVLPPSSMAPPRQFLRSKHALLSLWFHLSYNVLIQGSPTGFYTGNWSILYAVWHISFYFYYDICQTVSTESCKIIPAKFRELSLNFQKLADWLCMGWPRCLAALRHAISVTLE